MKHKTQQKSGFTIIEVVLVLAVAGLIFLVVFAAIPRLQASRRDNQRKRDMEQLLSLVIEYQSNTGSSLPNTTAGMRGAFDAIADNSTFEDYVEDANFEDPSGNSYVSLGTATASQDPGLGEFYYDRRVCNTDNSAIVNGTSAETDIAIIIGLERGEYCVDNS